MPPMPILRRQTHMVIVTGCANAQQAGCGGGTTVDDTSNGNGGGQIAVSPGDIQLHNLQPCIPGSSAALEPGSYRSSNPISPRYIYYIFSIYLYYYILLYFLYCLEPCGRFVLIRNGSEFIVQGVVLRHLVYLCPRRRLYVRVVIWRIC